MSGKHTNSDSNLKGLYTVREAGAELGVTEDTVRKWIRLGRLQAKRLAPRTTRITREALDALLAASPGAAAGHE